MSSSSYVLLSDAPAKKQKKSNKNGSNPAPEKVAGAVKEPEKVARSGVLEVSLKTKSVGFSFVDFLGKPRWVVTSNKKIHMEILFLLREIRETSFDDI